MTNIQDKEVTKLFWATVRSFTMYKFNEYIQKLRKNHKESFIQISKIFKEKWTFTLFPLESMYEFIT